MAHGRITAAMTLALMASGALAQTPEGMEFQVNSYTPLDQGYPSVCRSQVGDFVVVWESAEQDGDGRGVFAQRFDSGGAAVGGEFQVNVETLDHQQLPNVACGADGSFVVAWESRGQDGDGYGVFARRYDAGGAPMGGEFQVNTYTTEWQVGASVCAAADGSFVVAWQSYEQDGDSEGVFAQRFDSAGALRGDEFQANAYTLWTQAFPATACDTAGDFIIVWHSDLQDGDSYGVFGQRFASDGTPRGAEFQVNSYTEYSQQLPDVSTDGAGSFVVVWESYDYQDGDSYGVFGQRFASDGSAEGAEFQVTSYTRYAQLAPQVSTAPDGAFVVVWSSGQDGDGYGMFGRRFERGTQPGPEFQINSYTPGYQGAYAAFGRVAGVASDERGDFVVAWQSFDPFGTSQDGDGFGVFGQRFSAPVCAGDCDRNGTVITAELIRGVNIAFEVVSLETCPAFDSDASGSVTIDELVAGVDNSVLGCG
jgi:hypothetical protein